MISVPKVTDNHQMRREVVELVDLFPTLVDAAGFPPLPTCPKKNKRDILCTEGRSLMSLIENNNTVQWKNLAFSQYPRMASDGNYVMGYSVRSNQYRYTEWVDFTMGPKYEPIWGRILHHSSVELYDHEKDPMENINLAWRKSYNDVVKRMRHLLKYGWQHSSS